MISMLSSSTGLFASLLLLSANTVVGSPIGAHSSSSTGTLAKNFTLAALNNTLPNANSTGAPLVLGAGGAIHGAEFYVSSTYFSYPYNDYPSLGLVDGNLRAYDRSGGWHTNATAPYSTSGPYSYTTETLSWVSSGYYTSTADTSFSAASVDGSAYPALAVNGVSDLWYLCPSDAPRGENRVYCNTSSIPSQESGGDGETIECHSVTLNMVPA